MAKVMPILANMDGQVMTVLNIIISYVINIFVLIIFGISSRVRPEKKVIFKEVEKVIDISERKEAKYEQKLSDFNKEIDSLKTKLVDTTTKLTETKNKLYDAKKEITINKENFNVSLRSIEDKCKAINFVIGRVYSDKRGASAKIRDRLRIDSRLYNKFSELTSDFKEEDAEKLSKVLEKIHDRLLQLEFPESKFIKITDAQTPTERDVLGNDRIIDVLKKNDKDPIEDYYTEAKDICQKLLQYVTEMYTKNNSE